MKLIAAGTGVIVAVLLGVFLVGSGFDEAAYNQNSTQVQANDLLATQVFEADDAPDDEYLQIVEGGIVKYNENLDLLRTMKQSPGLPADKLEQVEDIEQYTDLRIQQFSLILEATKNEDLSLVDDITNLGLRIEALGIYQDGAQTN